MNKKLSIIIPVYNVEKYVEKCIRSCENQDIPKEDYEVIVVNDGSPDGSLAIVERLAQEYSNIKVISQENKGQSVARNVAMRIATGDYYMFVDSDDWIVEDCLSKIITKIENESPDVVSLCIADVYGGILQRRNEYQDIRPMAGRDLLKHGVINAACSAIWSSSFLKKHDLYFFEGIYHEDSELYPKAYYLARKVSFINDIIYIVYQNPNSTTRTVNPKKVFDVLNVVAPNLYSYANDNVETGYKKYFYNIICSNINTVLGKNKGIAEEDRLKTNKIFYGKRYLIKSFLRSSFLRYKLEGILLVLFPSKLVNVYNFLTK